MIEGKIVIPKFNFLFLSITQVYIFSLSKLLQKSSVHIQAPEKQTYININIIFVHVCFCVHEKTEENEKLKKKAKIPANEISVIK